MFAVLLRAQNIKINAKDTHAVLAPRVSEAIKSCIHAVLATRLSSKINDSCIDVVLALRGAKSKVEIRDAYDMFGRTLQKER
jgi:hypothetical protein